MSVYSHTESRRSRMSDNKVEQQMAAMIDVVFLLLIFFVITVKPENIMSHLEVMRPAQEKIRPVDPPPLLEIEIFADNYVICGKKVTLENLEESLKNISEYSTSSGIIIKCASKTKHARLIRVLNVCEKTGFKKISLMSI